MRGFLGATLRKVDLRLGVDGMSELFPLGMIVDVEAEVSSKEGRSEIIVGNTLVEDKLDCPCELPDKTLLSLDMVATGVEGAGPRLL